MNPTKVSGAITASFKKYVDREGEGMGWRFVSEELKNMSWDEFTVNIYIL